MGETKVIKKFQQLLSECDKEPFANGTITEFDTVGYVPKERHVKETIVDSNGETSRVDFYFESKKYIEDIAPLSVGDEVLVFGKKNPSRPKTILPNIIMELKNKLVLLSREQEIFRFEGGVEYAKAASVSLFFILGVISWLSNDIPFILFGTFFLYWKITFWFGLGSVLFFFLFITITIYDHRARRGRVLQCDTETWELMRDEVTKRFDVFH